MKQKLILTRRQIDKLVEIVNHFYEVNLFALDVDSDDDTRVSVSFSLFENDTDAKEDLLRLF